MAGVLAAVVGVIANLALYFETHTLLDDVSTATWGPAWVQLPDGVSVDPVFSVIAAVAVVLLFRYRCSVLRTLAGCAALGLVAGLLTAAAS